MPVLAYVRDQQWLLPPSLDECVPVDHPARFVAEIVDGLTDEQLAAMGMPVAGSPLGRPSFSVRALLSIWLLGFMSRVRSSRKLETACQERLPFLWIAGLEQPDHNTLWLFYKKHRQKMRWLLRHSVEIAVQAGLVDLAIQAVDGTKIWGNAALKQSRTQEGLAKLLAKTDAAIADLEAQNVAGEAEPPKLKKAVEAKQELRATVQTAMAVLARRTAAKAGSAEPTEPAPATAEQPTATPGKGKRPSEPQVNLSDLDAQVLKGQHGGYLAGYNAQAAVSPLVIEPGEKKRTLILATLVVQDAGDVQQLVPMVEAVEAMTGGRPETLADGGYHSAANLAAMEARGQPITMPDPKAAKPGQQYAKEHFVYDEASDTYRCPEGQTLRRMASPVARPGEREAAVRYQAASGVCGACLVRALCQPEKPESPEKPKEAAPPAPRRKKAKRGRSITITSDEARLREHRERMAGAEAKARYRQRQELIEPKFGNIKDQQDGRRMLLRGLENVTDEWTLLSTTSNLRTLWAVWAGRPVERRFALRTAAA